MNRFRYLTAGLVIAGMLAGGAAFAQGPRGGGAGRGGRGLAGGLPLQSLNLTQAQQDLIRDIRERSGDAVRQAQTRLRDAQQTLAKAAEALPVNEAQIRTAALAVGEAEAEVAIQQARVQGEIFAALTPAQQEQVKRARAEREARLQQREQQQDQRRPRKQQ